MHESDESGGAQEADRDIRWIDRIPAPVWVRTL
jgi:hypothetical protein